MGPNMFTYIGKDHLPIDENVTSQHPIGMTSSAVAPETHCLFIPLVTVLLYLYWKGKQYSLISFLWILMNVYFGF